MSESLPAVITTQSTSLAASRTQARDLAATAPASPTKLTVGMQLEIQPGRHVSAMVLDVRMRPMGGDQQWTATTRVQLAKPLPDQLVRQLGSAANSQPAALATPRMRAEVVSVSPALVLRILAPEMRPVMSATPAPAPGSREWIGQQLRQHWPESRPLAATLEGLASRIADTDPASRLLPMADPTLGTRVQHSLESLLGQLSTHRDLTDPERLATALKGAGPWLEAHLAQSVAIPAPTQRFDSDLKARLLSLAQQLRSLGAPTSESSQRAQSSPSRSSTTEPAAGATPERTAPPPGQPNAAQRLLSSWTGELIRKAAGLNKRQLAEGLASTSLHAQGAAPERQSMPAASALARDVDGMLKQLVTHQLQALDSTPDAPHWVLELPFKTPAGLIALETDIRRERPADASDDPGWSMRLHLNLPQLGPVTIKLSLRAERLSASLQAQTETGAATLKHHLETLRKQLEAREIQLASLHAGYRPAERTSPPFDAPLVREKA